MFITKTEYSTYSTLMSDLITDLKSIGFTEILADPLVLEAGASIDPLSATQPWRISVRVFDNSIVMFSGTDDQLKSDGSFEKPLKHYFCNVNDITKYNTYDYILSSKENGISLSIHKSKGDNSNPTWNGLFNLNGHIRRMNVYNDKFYIACSNNGLAFSTDNTATTWNNLITSSNYTEATDFCETNDFIFIANNNYSVNRYEKFENLNNGYITSDDLGYTTILTYLNGNYYRLNARSNNFDLYKSTNGYDWTLVLNSNANSNNIHNMDMAYSNSILIATGGYQYIWRSDDNGDTWTRVDTTTYSYGIAHNGKTDPNSLWVVGSHDGIKHSTDNGLTWTNTTFDNDSEFNSHHFYDVEYIPEIDKFYAVSNNGKVVESSNGIDWTLQSNPTTTQLNRIKYYNGVILIGGNYGTLFKSIDSGTTWENIGASGYKIDGYVDDNMNTKLMSINSFNWAISNNGYTFSQVARETNSEASGIATNEYFDSRSIWAVACDNRHLYISTDKGLTWSRPATDVTDVCYANGHWVATTTENHIRYSPDGVNWKHIGANSYLRIEHNGEKGDNSLWIASNGNNNNYGGYSYDGINFTYTSDIPRGYIVHNKKGINGIWMSAGYDQIHTSIDGFNWEQSDISILPYREIKGLDCCNGVFYIYTNSSYVYTTKDGINFKILFDNTDTRKTFMSNVKHTKATGLDNTVFMSNNSLYNNYRLIPDGSVVSIQRPVIKTSGLILDTGKAPVVQYGSNVDGSMLVSVLREEDRKQPTLYRDLTEFSDMFTFGLPSVMPRNDDNPVTMFAYGLSTGRHFYQVELDMIGVIRNADIVVRNDVSISMYDEVNPRTYYTIPMFNSSKPIKAKDMSRYIIFKNTN